MVRASPATSLEVAKRAPAAQTTLGMTHGTVREMSQGMSEEHPGPTEETLEGFVVDIACLRKYPSKEILERASRHTRDCALMPHCIESGFGLVTDAGQLVPLDTEATMGVVDALRGTDAEHGIRVRVEREREGEEMRTRSVELA